MRAAIHANGCALAGRHRAMRRVCWFRQEEAIGVCWVMKPPCRAETDRQSRSVPGQITVRMLRRQKAESQFFGPLRRAAMIGENHKRGRVLIQTAQSIAHPEPMPEILAIEIRWLGEGRLARTPSFRQDYARRRSSRKLRWETISLRYLPHWPCCRHARRSEDRTWPF